MTFPLLAAALAAFTIACGNGNPAGPSDLATGGTTSSIVDMPPLTPNSCPGDAPTQIRINVENPTASGLYPVLFDFRRTGATNSYVLETRKREVNTMLPATFSGMDARENGQQPVRYLLRGIYHFRLRGNCPGSLWSVEVIKNVGESAMPDIEEVPPVKPEEPSECDEVASLSIVPEPCPAED